MPSCGDFTRPSLIGITRLKNVTVRNIKADGEEYLAMSRSMTEFGDTPWHIGIYAPWTVSTTRCAGWSAP